MPRSDVKSIASHRARRRQSLYAYLAILLALVLSGGVSRGASQELCLECIDIRLDRPIVVRGPSRAEPDAPVSVVKLPDGRFRGFSANVETVAIEAATPLDLGGPAKFVLKPGPSGSASECGRWLTSVLAGKDALYGLVHNERHCNGQGGGTYKSMAIARSFDYGLRWDVLGQIITGDAVDFPSLFGVGDCTGVDGHDGYWYAYCLRQRDWKNVVARAPGADPRPGKWMEWDGADWRQPALGGVGAALIKPTGTSAAYWIDAGVVLLLGTTDSGLQLSISKDKVDFDTLAAPLILYDESDWKRPAATELYAYPSLIARQGLNDISGKFLLAYMYIPPGQDFTQRYLVLQEGRIALARAARQSQVQIALTRWVGAKGRTWTTTGPTISPGRSYAFGTGLGYVMTAAGAGLASSELDECFSASTGVGFLAESGHCAAEGSVRRRSVGYVDRDHQAGTIPLVDCQAKDGTHFTSNHMNCEAAGARKRVLGYAFR
jgi:hypothetical protein